MRDIKFRLINRFNKIVGYEKWYTGVWDKDKSWSALPCWLYSTDQKSWRPEEIKHRTKDQYTGLHDKNGKEIYEGDILEYHDGTGVRDRDKVEWLIDGWYCAQPMHTLFLHKYWEIIGNIYENPELLEADKPYRQSEVK